ncbi:hypothetical protein PLAN_40971 [Planktothrix rubescens CCAP 1459/22]|uniref:Uncharacterized protein n=1 Tax=Planktothrix rubescens CCAP 1459/22 TaxID=329571 RepID=A0A6J7ZR99_PLARU|nr:hypothetical protein PLAN_40971 [Planktothrix rubescens NIVA-CYA 18]CAD0232447.1 hypothetical protein PL10110_750024 [Planktothrix agardhii]
MNISNCRGSGSHPYQILKDIKFYGKNKSWDFIFIKWNHGN